MKYNLSQGPLLKPNLCRKIHKSVYNHKSEIEVSRLFSKQTKHSRFKRVEISNPDDAGVHTKERKKGKIVAAKKSLCC